jgi:endonuclease/exonuclease/phosphatase family metal-dependent hydrolase
MASGEASHSNAGGITGNGTEAGAGAAHPSERRLIAASYNIHRCIGMDGRQDPGRVARVIRELGADVIGLQEVDSGRSGASGLELMERIAGATGLHVIPGPTIMSRDGHYGNVMLTGSRVREIRRLDLSLPGREPRGAIDADLDVEGEPVRVVVTHLGLAPSERRAQVRRLLDVLAAGDDYGLTVVMGDINEWMPGSRPLRWLQRRLGRSPAPRTFPATFPVFALDRIWVWPKGALLSVAAHATAAARAASDHLPLRAVLSMDSLASGRVPPGAASTGLAGGGEDGITCLPTS